MPEFALQKARVVGRNPAAPDAGPSAGVGKHTLAERLPPGPALDEEASAALQMLAHLLQNAERGLRATDGGKGAPTRYDSALATIGEAARGQLDDAGTDGRTLLGTERVRYLDAGLAALAPLLERANADPGWRLYVAQQVTPALARVRARALASRAEQRAREALAIGGNVFEIVENASPEAEAAPLREAVHRIIEALKLVDESAIRVGHDQVEHTAHHMMTGHGHGGKLGAGNLVDVMNALQVADALLILTDHDLQHELNHPEGFFAGVSSVAEVVKASIELLGSAIALAGYMMAAVGSVTGSASAVTQGLGFARMTNFQFGNVIAVVEMVHGCAVLADPHAKASAKESAAADVVSSGAWLLRQSASFATKHVALPEETAAVLGELGTFAGAASIAAMVQYAELRLLADQYWTARSSLVALGTNAISVELLEDSSRVTTASQHLSNAGVLAQRETDADERAALHEAELTLARELGQAIDSLLMRATATPVAGSVHVAETGQLAMRPGASVAVREAFAPLQALRGTSTTPESARRNATAVLAKVGWCLEHANVLARAEVEGTTADEQAPAEPAGERE